jgi:hypothetical protein
VLLEEVCGAYAACIKPLFAVAFILPSVPSETLKWTRRAFERVGTALTQSSGAIAFWAIAFPSRRLLKQGLYWPASDALNPSHS